jgi:hypothetical protein
MRDTRLIFIEGIVGAGKSTTAAWLTVDLQRRQLAARVLLEGPTLADPMHPLRMSTSLPHPQGVWQDVTVEEYIARSLGKWRSFVAQAQQTDEVTVSDGLLFHGNMADLLLMNAAASVLAEYVGAVLETAAPLRPVVIYLRRAEVRQALQEIATARGAAWEAYQSTGKPAARTPCSGHSMGSPDSSTSSMRIGPCAIPWWARCRWRRWCCSGMATEPTLSGHPALSDALSGLRAHACKACKREEA